MSKIQYFFDSLINSNDIEDQNVNYAIYYFGRAFMEILNYRADIRSEIYRTASTTNIRNVYIYQILANHPEIVNTFKSKLSSYSGQTVTNYKTFLDAILTHTGIQYEPVVLVYNYDNCDTSLTPYYALGTQINEGNYPNKPDYIPIWNLTDTSCGFTTIGEETANDLERPLFIFTNHEFWSNENVALVSKGTSLQSKTLEGNSSASVLIAEIHAESFSFSYPYEATGNVDYSIYMGGNSNISEACWDEWYLNYPRSKVGVNILRWTAILSKTYPRPASTGYWFPSSDERAQFINTYERDWYASVHTLGKFYVLGIGSWRYPAGRMKYSDNWYSYNPNTYDGYNLFGYHPYNWNIHDIVSKGHLKLWRIDNTY